MPRYLDGIFSFALYDRAKNRLVVARDPLGVTTLYQGWSATYPEAVYFASELKALHPVCDDIIAYPPGHIFDSLGSPYTRYYRPNWWYPQLVPSMPVNYQLLRETLEKSVHKRLVEHTPYGVLLSGGLDSSLIAAMAVRKARQSQFSSSGRASPVGSISSSSAGTLGAGGRLRTFSIGLEGSPDTKAAQTVADFLETDHYGFTYTIAEGLDAIRDVIYHLETFDVTTIRASTPMFLLSRKIKSTGVKVVLSGEGSDEIFGGYLYFKNAPSPDAFHGESVRRVKGLHLFDCLRANKSTLAWGLEARVPFLDKEVGRPA